ncbi:uncharacterized protein LOC129298145 [Prosopis cineraria]|uniref:uncharacterized protein LOC129298145 n=1 Tax=Prosopis cineraria TaxID=364024 RepID=UPI00240F545E|nr:uncharacterized protein LOC129298145 [Prosopis cineraria]
MTTRGPNVIIPPAEKERLAKKWKNTLIVTLLGRMVRSEYMESKLPQMWGCYGDIEVIDKENFESNEEKITKIVDWIHISQLPLDYYDQGILYVLGSQIDHVLKVETTTIKRKKGRFARLCVKLDLNATLRPIVLINRKEKRIQYESIHLICLKCGRYKHDADNCPVRPLPPETMQGQALGNSSNKGESVNVNPKAIILHMKLGAMEDGKEVMEVAESDVCYEEWMIVQRRRRFQCSSGSKNHIN